ncbi:MAG: DUF3467 domain-containing protein [Acidobacteriota bacterium]
MSQGDEAQPKRREIQVKVTEEVASGVYSNMVMAHHTDSEFTIDFLHVQPQAPVALVRSRVITSPRNVRRLIKVLQESLDKYEMMHGTVEMPPANPGEFKH